MRQATVTLAAALLLTGAASARPNMVGNGGFETGDFTSWTQFGNTSFTGVFGTFAGVSPTHGVSQAYFGPLGSTGGISQSLAVTAGDIVDISFDLYNFGGSPNEFYADIGGTNLLSLFNTGAFTYTTFTYTGVVVGATGDAISFTTRQDPSYWLLDNVSVDLSSHAIIPLPSAAGMGFAGLMGLAGRRRQR